MIKLLWTRIKDYVFGGGLLLLVGLFIWQYISNALEEKARQKEIAALKKDLAETNRRQVDQWTAQMDSSLNRVYKRMAEGDSSLAHLYLQYNPKKSTELNTRLEQWLQTYHQNKP